MYCRECGKQLASNAKFCPKCGARVGQKENKKIVIDSNVTPEALQKRAFMLIEDEDFSAAEDYLDRLLDIEPENAHGYMGKLLVSKRFSSLDKMEEYYKELYSSEEKEVVAAEIEDAKDEHIAQMAKDYAIKNYLDEDLILQQYRNYDEAYLSALPCRLKQKEKIEEEFDSDRMIARVRSFGQEEYNKRFDNILKEYDKRIRNAKKEDKKKAEEIIANYPAFIEQTDKLILEMHEKAAAERDADYEKCVSDLDQLSNKTSVSELIRRFEKFCGYKESEEYINKCQEKIRDLEQEEIEENQRKQKAKQKRIRIILIALILLIFSYFIYTLVIVPSNKYNNALEYYNNEKYEEALTAFEELGDYKDSKDMVNQTMYKQAVKSMNEKEYEKAISLFEELKDFEDASQQLNNARYVYGEQLLENKNYDQALAYFALLNNYKDSKEKVLKTEYEKALYLREERKYDDSIALFEELGEYEDSADQKTATEKEKAANSVKIPSVVGKGLDSAKKSLDKLELTYTVSETEKADKKAGTVLSVSPKEGEVVLKGTKVTLNAAKGLAKYNNYTSDGNTKVLYQVNITSSGNNIMIRKNPHLDSSNRLNKKTKSGEAYNVYETVQNEGYTFIRTDNNEWFATEGNWVERDSYCSDSGTYMNSKAWINDTGGSGVYDRPSENAEVRQWLESIPYGTEVTVYYRFNNGSHNWYKIGANRWIKDIYGEKVIFY